MPRWLPMARTPVIEPASPQATINRAVGSYHQRWPELRQFRRSAPGYKAARRAKQLKHLRRAVPKSALRRLIRLSSEPVFPARETQPRSPDYSPTNRTEVQAAARSLPVGPPKRASAPIFCPGRSDTWTEASTRAVQVSRPDSHSQRFFPTRALKPAAPPPKRPRALSFARSLAPGRYPAGRG